MKENIYYNSKLGSGCNLDKDLRKDKKNDQLVRHKDTGLYLQLYIPSDHEKRKRYQKRKI